MAAPAEASGKYTFAIALVAGPPPTFTITATATGKQASDGNLTLNSLGQKTPAEKWVK
jgi:type IV pilus assembly protein PilE